MILRDFELNPIESPNDGVILSCEDFFNFNSIYLAWKFELPAEEVPSYFLRFLDEKRQGKPEKVIDSMADPINFYQILSKKYASSAIVHYELVNREEISFAYDGKIILFRDTFGPDFHLTAAKNDDDSAHRFLKYQDEYYKILLRN
ncbi:MAG: hypothetical protein Q8Q04_00560 [archaeon]|nr:hypothetical protein [archaeon]